MARLSVSRASPYFLVTTSSNAVLLLLPPEADLVVMAVGITPRDDLARSSGIKVASRGGIDVDDSYVSHHLCPEGDQADPSAFSLSSA